MAIGAFTDTSAPPSADQLEAELAGSLSAWRAVTALLEGAYRAAGDMRYYGRNYGWALRYRSRGRALASLYPGKGSFTLQIVLSEEAVGRLPRERLRTATAASLVAATPHKEGRWLFVPVVAPEDVAEVETLLEAKQPSRPAG